MIDSIDNIIKTHNFPPVLLMFGEEEFLLDEAYQRLVEAAVDEETGSFNFDLLEGSESTPETVVEMASAFPMMAERRVVAVRHFDKLVSGRGGSRAEQKSPLASYFTAPSPTTFLILLASVPDLNGLAAAINNPKQKAKAEKKLKNLEDNQKDLERRIENLQDKLTQNKKEQESQTAEVAKQHEVLDAMQSRRTATK